MKDKLTLNEEIEAFLNSDKRELWGAISTDDTEKILSIVSEDLDNTLSTIVSELFTKSKSDTLENKNFELIEDGNSYLIRDLVKLVFSLDINGEKEDLRLYLGERLFDSVIPNTVNSIREQVKNYPKHSINPLIWTEGAEMRAALNAFIFYYKLKDNIEALHFLIMNRTQLSLSVMSHYKNILGPDMIEAARIKEQIGEKETALSFYKAIESEFKGELSWFTSTPEAGPSDEDIITLKVLKEALLAIDRLSETNEYTTICEQIDEVLSREVFEIPNFDDDDDEE